MNGIVSEATEGFAVGVTLLVVLTNRDPVDIEDACEEDHGDTPFAEIAPERLAESAAGWPVEVAAELKQLYMRLCVVKKRHRLALSEVLESLRSLVLTAGPAQVPSAEADAMLPAAYEPTPLSVHVRRLGATASLEERLGRNVRVLCDLCPSPSMQPSAMTRAYGCSRTAGGQRLRYIHG